jgi:hypothetical protein
MEWTFKDDGSWTTCSPGADCVVMTLPSSCSLRRRGSRGRQDAETLEDDAPVALA